MSRAMQGQFGQGAGKQRTGGSRMRRSNWRRAQIPGVLLHVLREVLVLVGGNKVDARSDRCLPAQNHCLLRSEVVAVPPSLIFSGSKTIQGIETNPVAHLVCMID